MSTAAQGSPLPFAHVSAAQSCSISRIDGGAFSSPPQMGGMSAVSPSDAWAVGSYGGISAIADHWNGKRWHVVFPPTAGNSGLNAVSARAANDVWAVGFGVNGAWPIGTLVEHWDGSSWAIVPSPNSGKPSDYNFLNGVAAFAPDVAFAVGYRGYQMREPIVEAWNGRAWSILETPGPRQGGYYAIAGSGGSDVWAVGGTAAGKPLALHYDGTMWKTVAVPVPPNSQYSNFDGVVALAPDDVWAVGGSSRGRNVYRNLTEHWNGSAWSIVPSPNAPWLQTQGLLALSARAVNDIWAVGAGPVAIHWDGTRWSLTDTRQFANQLAVFAAAAPIGATSLIAGYSTLEPTKQLFAQGSCP